MDTKSVAARNTVFGVVLTSLVVASSAIAALAGELYPADVQYQAIAAQSRTKSRLQVPTEAALARAG